MAKNKTVKSEMKVLLSYENTTGETVDLGVIEYFCGLTSSNEESSKKEERDERIEKDYAEMSGTYGFSAISSVTAKVGYEDLDTHEEIKTETSITKGEIKKSVKMTIPVVLEPHKGLYLYQPSLPVSDELELGIEGIVYSDRPIINFPTVEFAIIGTSSDVSEGGNARSLQCHRDTHFTLALSTYDGAGIYMGDRSVLDIPDNNGAEWKFIKVDDKDDFYWIKSVKTGKLLSWYPGQDVYPGDDKISSDQEAMKKGSLWKVYPTYTGEYDYYIQPFTHSDKLLSWYKDNGVYVGDKTAIDDPKSKSGTMWKLEPISSSR